MNPEFTASMAKLDQLQAAGILSESEYKEKRSLVIDRYIINNSTPAIADYSLAPTSSSSMMSVAVAKQQQQPIPYDPNRPICSLHNKARTSANLVQVSTDAAGNPLYHCAPNSVCKMSSAEGGFGKAWACLCGTINTHPTCIICGNIQQSGFHQRGFGVRPAPYARRGGPAAFGALMYGGMGMGGFGGGGGAGAVGFERTGPGYEKILCARHGKIRSSNVLVEEGGLMVCRADVQCKAGARDVYTA